MKTTNWLQSCRRALGALAVGCLSPAIVLSALAVLALGIGPARAGVVISEPTSIEGTSDKYVTFTLSDNTTASTTWTVPSGVTKITYLVVGGGGGGGGGYGGGGGAGGLVYKENQTVTAGATLTIQVGAGGDGGDGGVSGKAGSASTLTGDGISETGSGGGLGGSYRTAGGSGGSGGGAGGGGTSAEVSGGSPVSGQGFAGGSVTTTAGSQCGAGGGGAGADGQNGGAYAATGCGNGGAGVAKTITGTSVTYAGGGGGGNNTNPQRSGGAGGGGDGAVGGGTQFGDDGTDGLGGGGGGGAGSANGKGGRGGSGVVIIRYATGTTPTGAVDVDFTTGKITSGGVEVGTAKTLSSGEKVLQFTKTGLNMTWEVPEGVSSLRYLVVGGGGGGGGSPIGGGGGAGGFLTSAGYLVTPGASYTITVGAGGQGGQGQNDGSDGDPSTFATITASGGGHGGRHGSDAGSGGSGGGGSSGTAGAGISAQGNAGGAGASGSAGGGGGGAGDKGNPGMAKSGDTPATAGDGGEGMTSDITGTSESYAGGGGGGTNQGGSPPGIAGKGNDGGGDGGDGSISTTSHGSAGTTPGSGGGGAGYVNYSGGNGADGIVILRYSEGPVKTALKSVALYSSSGVYNGGSFESTIKGLTLTVTDAKNQTVNSSNYSVAYKRGGSAVADWTSAGAITVEVTANADSDYSGTVSATYTISPAALTSLSFSPSSYTGDGTTKTPTLTVKAGSGSLTLTPADYDVTSGQVSASEKGTYNVTVTGKGNFTGTASAFWSIVDCDHTPVQYTYQAATCTEPGHEADGYLCSKCYAQLQAPTVIPALGHELTDWVVDPAPTLTTEGHRERHCTRSGCDYREEETLPTIGWTFYPEEISGQRDGIISNSVGQILNVYFADNERTKLVVGVRNAGNYPSSTDADKGYNVAVPRDKGIGEEGIGRLDLTGGVKNGETPTTKYVITEIGTQAFNAQVTGTLSKFARQQLDSVILPDELEVIGAHAFKQGSVTQMENCRLKSLRYSGGKIRSIGQTAFYFQSAMVADVAELVTPSIAEIGAAAFQSCASLVGHLNTEGLTTIPHDAFVHCVNLTSIDLPNVTSLDSRAIGSAYNNPVSFKFGTQQVTAKDDSFTAARSTADCVVRLWFPGAAPNFEESFCPVFRELTANCVWKKSDDGTLNKRAYVIFDNTKVNDDDWLGFRKYLTANDLPSELPIDNGTGTASVDKSVADVTVQEVAEDLGVNPDDVDIFGFHLVAGTAASGNIGVYKPVMMVAVPSRYFEAANDYFWKNADGGIWREDANWTPTGHPKSTLDSAAFTSLGKPFTVQASDDEVVKAVSFNQTEVTLDFPAGRGLLGSDDGSVKLAMKADQSDIAFVGGTFAFTNSWFDGDAKTLSVEGADVSFTGDGDQKVRSGSKTANAAPLDFVWAHIDPQSGASVTERTYPNVAVTDGGSLTVASPAGTTLSNFMLDSVWGRGVINGGTLAYSNNGDTSGQMAFTNGLVVANGGSVTGASKLVLRGGETSIAAGSTVGFTSLSVEGPAKGVIAAVAAGGTLGVTLTSAAAGADLTFKGIALGDVTGQANGTSLTFGEGATGSGTLSYSGTGCTTVFDGGTFKVPSDKSFALGTTPTLKFVLPTNGFTAAQLTVQTSGTLANGTTIEIDASQYSGAVVEDGIPLVKMASAITLDNLTGVGVPVGMELGLKDGDNTTLVLKLIGYKVTFDANGGMPATQEINVAHGLPYGKFPEVENTGWKLVGWFTDATGGDRKYPFDTVTSDHTLYAHWEQSTYEVTYDYAGGTKGSENPTPATYGTAFAVSAPTKANYTFAGWTVTSGLNALTAVWGTTSNPETKIPDSTTKCVNGTTGDVYFKDLTTGDSVTLTANWLEQISLPQQSVALVYNGEPQNVTLTPDAASGHYTITGGTQSETNVGDYTVKVTPGSGYCWSDGTTVEKDVNWSIARPVYTTDGTESGRKIAVDPEAMKGLFGASMGTWQESFTTKNAAGIAGWEAYVLGIETAEDFAKLTMIITQGESTSTGLTLTIPEYEEVTKAKKRLVEESSGLPGVSAVKYELIGGKTSNMADAQKITEATEPSFDYKLGDMEGSVQFFQIRRRYIFDNQKP